MLHFLQHGFDVKQRWGVSEPGRDMWACGCGEAQVVRGLERFSVTGPTQAVGGPAHV